MTTIDMHTGVLPDWAHHTDYTIRAGDTPEQTALAYVQAIKHPHTRRPGQRRDGGRERNPNQ